MQLSQNCIQIKYKKTHLMLQISVDDGKSFDL